MSDDSPNITEVSINDGEGRDSAYDGVSISACASVMGYHNGLEFNPYDHTLARQLQTSTEYQLYPLFGRCYNTNPYAYSFINYLYTHILGEGWRLEGPGSRSANRFMKRDNTMNKLNSGVLFTSCKYGNGMMDDKVVGGKLKWTRPINPLCIYVTNNPNPKNYEDTVLYYEHSIPTYDMTTGLFMNYNVGATGKALDRKHFTHFKLYDAPFNALAPSPLRSTQFFLTALADANGDVSMAIKRAAYAPHLAKLDLDGVSTQEEKQRIIANFNNKLKEAESAGMNITIDKRHEFGYVGTMGGGGGALSLPVNDLLSPMMSICMFVFGVPLGLIQQTGANKSIIEKQIEDVSVMIRNIRRRFADIVESNILSKITSQDVEVVWNRPAISSLEYEREANMIFGLVDREIITKDTARAYFDIRTGE